MNKTYCEKCQHDIDINDVYYGEFGIGFVDCPYCGHQIETEKTLNLNSHNLEYPEHFFHFGGGAVDVSNEQIQKETRKLLKFMEDNPEAPFAYWATGNTNITILRFEEEDTLEIIVSKNYQETCVEGDTNE